MPASSSPDNVYMEFLGPVPGVLGTATGYHVVFWLQAAGGAGFTRPSQEECDYYAETGKPVPEWQCEYFDFDGLAWPEATLTVELWHGASKLRSLFIPGRKGRTEAEVHVELPELERFINKNGLASFKIALTFHEALLRAAADAGVIQRGLASAAPRPHAATHAIIAEESWWRRTLRRLWPRRRPV